MELCMPTANKEVHFSSVECSNTPVVIKQERQVGSRVASGLGPLFFLITVQGY